MSLNQLLQAMSHDITSLSGGEKLLGGLLATVFSMSIVFLVLIILMGVIKAMDKLLNREEKSTKENSVATVQCSSPSEEILAEEVWDEKISQEEIAAVMAAISTMSQSSNRLVVRQINRTAPAIPSWSQAAMGPVKKSETFKR